PNTLYHHSKCSTRFYSLTNALWKATKNITKQNTSFIFFPNSDDINLDHVKHIITSLSNTPSEIQYLIKNLPLKKYPGQDLINNFIIKHLPKRAILFSTQLYNSILRLSD
ncbi:putative RNA-directed DNA polymerase, partial [Aphis craccivora]